MFSFLDCSSGTMSRGGLKPPSAMPLTRVSGTEPTCAQCGVLLHTVPVPCWDCATSTAPRSVPLEDERSMLRLRDIVPVPFRERPLLGVERENIVPCLAMTAFALVGARYISPSYISSSLSLKARHIVPVGCLSPFLVLKHRSSGLNRNRIILSIFVSHIMKEHSMRIKVFGKNIRFFFPTPPIACALSRDGFQPSSAMPLTRVSSAMRRQAAHCPGALPGSALSPRVTEGIPLGDESSIRGVFCSCRDAIYCALSPSSPLEFPLFAVK